MAEKSNFIHDFIDEEIAKGSTNTAISKHVFPPNPTDTLT